MADFAQMLYGTAQNAAQDVGQGLAQSIQAGAGLALKQQELTNQTQGMALKMQELQQAKIAKVYEFIQGAHNYTMAGDRNNYMAAGKGMRDASGISPSVMPDNVFDGMGSTDNMGRDVTARQMVENKIWTPEQYFKAKADPQAWSQLPVASPESYSMADADVTSAIKDVAAARQKVQEDQLNRENVLKAAQIKANTATENKHETFAQQDKTNFTKEIETSGDRIRAAFSPVVKEQGQASGALDARDRIAQALAKDPSGRSVSPQDVGQIVYPMLHSELGRVNQVELAHTLGINGAEGKAEGWLVDKVTGGMNPQLFKNLLPVVNSWAKSIDAEGQKKAASFQAEMDKRKDRTPEEKEQLLAAMAPLAKTVSRPLPGAGGAKVTLFGQSMTPAQAKSMFTDHPELLNDPSVDTATKKVLGY